MSAVLFLLGTGSASAYPASARSDVNMRAGPGTRYDVVDVLRRGEVVDVRFCVQAWCAVTHGGQRAYVSSRYLGAQRASSADGNPPPFSYPGGAGPQEETAYEGDIYGPQYCDVRGVRWALGRPLSELTVDRVLDDADAVTIRVVRPGDVYSAEYEAGRINIEVNRFGFVRNMRCG
jgi:hypothetical protein